MHNITCLTQKCVKVNKVCILISLGAHTCIHQVYILMQRDWQKIQKEGQLQTWFTCFLICGRIAQAPQTTGESIPLVIHNVTC